jgi:hypothetical protein
VRDTNNYDQLLGYIGEDGCRIYGATDKFNNDVTPVIDQVATDLEISGLFEDVVKLYDLGSKHNKVLQLLNKMLSFVIPERKVPDSKRTRLETLALKLAEKVLKFLVKYFLSFDNMINLLNRYCGHGCNASSDVSQTFYLLFDLMTFFDYYYNQQYNDALDVRIYLFNICLLIETIICRLSLNSKFCPFVTLTLI